ncbi:ATP-binding protein [Thermomonospora umbrina]|uniref:S-DNA-T family DNA segregation ATPase FtsK/SpoIIIE n=1 Tax=Thermomonospora umbrina TaxID=111806 RepID=A0A3D9SXQ0_9ACTN|nr:ATP-binding protein [Thermomonospora umbrina]REF00338.1 hypothetical protein DFJ69_5870 [Thermomonospora umbrina]
MNHTTTKAAGGAILLGETDRAFEPVIPTTEPAADTLVIDLPEGGKDDAGGRRWLPEGLGQRLRHDAYTTAWRLRRQSVPHAAAATVIGAGFAAEALVAAGTTTPLAASILAGGTAACATLGAVWRVRRRWPRWAGRVFWGGLAGTAWLTLAPYGLSPEHVGALAAVEYGLAARWWQTNRIGYPTGEKEEPVLVEEQPSTAQQIMVDWASYVGGQSGPLPGSRLSLPLPTKHTISFALELARGKQTLATVMANLDKISTGLNIGVADLVADAWPTQPGEKDRPARVRFQIVTDSPIRGNLDFDGPRRRGGLLDLGPYADGAGEAQYRLYTDGSMWSGVIIGGTGIGKSRLVENIVISALSGGDTEYIYIDPQNGVSSPALTQYAHWFGTMRNAGDVLNAVIAMLDARGEESAVEGWTGFTPGPQRPGLLIVIEECHNLFRDPNIARLWDRIAREGRKLGIALLCISQYPGLETFGGLEPLRSSVMEGNAIVLRSTSNQTGQLMPGMDVDPKSLPKIPGYGYIQGSEETGVRTAPFRNRNTGDQAGKWLVVQPRPGLDKLTATATLAAGTAYRERHVSEDTGRSASAARVQALRDGHLPADMIAGPAETQSVPSGEMGSIIAFPAPVSVEDLRRPTQPASAHVDLSASHLAVLKAVAAGASRPADVEKHVDLSPRRIATLLKELVASGHLTQPAYGRYQRAA